MICEFHACYEELPLCTECLHLMQDILTEKCPSCGKTAPICECGKDVRSLMFFHSAYSRRLLYFIKSNADKRNVDLLAEMAVKVCGINPGSYDAVTYVPRLRKNIRRYGHDQAKEIAKSISRIFGIPFITALERKGGKNQKLLSYSQRLNNAKNLYHIREIPENKYKSLLLVDDVSTTGATVNACKSILLKHSAKSVNILVLAKTVIDKRPK